MSQETITKDAQTQIAPPVLSYQAREKRPTWLARLAAQRSLIALVALILICIVVSPHTRRGEIIFLEVGNLTDVLRQVSEIGIIALAMTFVILTAGIDLSVGSTLAFGATVTALVLTHSIPHVGYTLNITLAILAGLAAGAVAGLVNGLLISRFSIQPFIITLAAMMFFRGLARSLTGGANVDIGFGNDVPAVFAALLSQKVVVIGVYIALAVIFAVLLKKTVFGRYIRAIGDNERAAIYAGIPRIRTTVWVYSLCGVCAGLAGVLHAAQAHQGNPNDGVAYELYAIAAVVIGGTSLAGGQGTITGTIVGTLIMGILTNILQLNRVGDNQQLMVTAAILVLAALAQSRKRTV